MSENGTVLPQQVWPILIDAEQEMAADGSVPKKDNQEDKEERKRKHQQVEEEAEAEQELGAFGRFRIEYLR